MKKMLALVLALGFALAYSGTYNKSIKGNIGQSIPLFGSQPNGVPSMSATVNLDTSEIDTSYYFYDLIDKPTTSHTDTVGWVHFSVKDSTGSDSAAARVVWWGNSRSDGLGVWSQIDSVTKGPTGSATVYAAATPTAVINSKGYMAIRFTLSNPLHFAVAQKCVVKDIVFNRRPRLGLVVGQ